MRGDGRGGSLSSEGSIEGRIDEPPHARRRDRADDPGELGLGRRCRSRAARETSGPTSRTPRARVRPPRPDGFTRWRARDPASSASSGSWSSMVRIGMAELYRTDVRLVKSTRACVRLSVMPLYEYRCNDCSAVYELLRPMADREVAAVCPSCESRASMPLISRVAVHAGSGTSEGPRRASAVAVADAAAAVAAAAPTDRSGQPAPTAGSATSRGAAVPVRSSSVCITDARKTRRCAACGPCSRIAVRCSGAP